MEQQVIYIKYSELTLKGKNRLEFIKQLNQNVKWALQEFNVKTHYYFDYMVVSNFIPHDYDQIAKILKLLPGIHAFSLAYILDKDLENLVKFCLNLVQNYLTKNLAKSFRITCSRQDKTFTTSNEIISLVAEQILKNTNLSVALKQQDINLKIEVKKENIVVFINNIKGIDGLPIGTSGKTLVLLSGGIDSPIAAKLMMHRGLKVDFITFITPPHTTELALQKVHDLANLITLNNKLCQARLYVCNFTNVQHELTHIKKESYRITLMRRQFFRIAKTIAMQHNIKSITTGESLGQVASQTIESMQVISAVLNNFLVFRPLIALDKQEIIKLANQFNTYNLSILPYDDSCSLFAPKNPVTKPNLMVAEDLEKECYLLNDIVDTTIKNHITIEELGYEKVK